MKWRLALVALLVAGVAHGDAPLSQPTLLALTTTDGDPSSADFAVVFGGSGSAIAELAAIAQDDTADVGVQLRAIRGLAEFPQDGAVPHDTLLAIVQANANARTGSQVLRLRAAIEALGALISAGGALGADDEPVLEGTLDNASRDVRATTALALGQLCDARAEAKLRARLAAETVDQVTLAISEALRLLGSCATPS